ncbi:MAG TPA: hypothetical protein VNN80_19000 [Polyangiaceae bacterium]|nr:hypothetical protein [Polyangiaceae bacterium]
MTTNIFVDQITQTAVDKIDLLFMIDNSISMSDKQEILRAAVPDLVNRLVNPICVDSDGTLQTPPAAPGDNCAAGFSREFNPINDINIGVVSSSLGDVGANVACPTTGFPRYVADRIDLAHLMGSLSRGAGTSNQPEGFLAWRSGQTNLDTLNRQFQDMVASVGENGCGWEASLESWYRFLVDPYPYERLVRVVCPGSTSTAQNCVQQATGADQRIVLDQTLLSQRAAFLRPDSLVAIIMLSDENDCSMQVGNQTWVVAAIDDARPMFRGSSTCDTDPNAKCCYSCPLGPPAGCQDDPICAADDANDVLENRLPSTEDGQNLRCFQQKRRFGVDFLYPTRRYVNALTNFDICWNDLELDPAACLRQEDIVPNPLYAGGRLPSLVFLGGIVGVPWQLIQADVDANNRPLPPDQLRFQTAAEMDLLGTWGEILGSPGRRWRPAGGGRPEVDSIASIPPSSPYMVESEFARAGVTAGNEINGREYSTLDTINGASDTPDDLEYACIFPLAAPRDCTTRDPATEACDCYQGAIDRPLCEQNPGQSAAGTTQYWAKAYPGTRHLEVLKDYGPNSIVASICARNVTDAAASDFGYRPAIAAIVDRLKEQLGDRCLPRSLATVPNDTTVACSLVETIPQPDGACNCDEARARRAPGPVLDSVVRTQLAGELGGPCGSGDPNCNNACLCEVLQVQQVTSNPADALDICRNDLEASGVEGWCYIDADLGIGNPELVANCPATQRRLLRFVGRGLEANSTTFVACTGSSFATSE